MDVCMRTLHTARTTELGRRNILIHILLLLFVFCYTIKTFSLSRSAPHFWYRFFFYFRFLASSPSKKYPFAIKYSHILIFFYVIVVFLSRSSISFAGQDERRLATSVIITLRQWSPSLRFMLIIRCDATVRRMTTRGGRIFYVSIIPLITAADVR